LNCKHSMNLSNVVEIINSNLSEPQASLLSGMLFGVKNEIPKDFYDALIVTGVLHVVSLSGMNISIITRVLFEWTSIVLGKLAGTILTILGIIAFVLFVGPSPTIVRASIMGLITIAGVYFGRKTFPLLSLFLAALTMFLIDKNIVSNLSFQLSFLSTLGIILFAREKLKNKARENIFGFIKKALFSDLRVTLSAQLFTLPVIFYNFKRISLISPLANIFTGWLVPPITYLGFFAIFISLISKTLAFFAFLIVWVPLTAFICLVNLFAQVPLASINF